MKYQSSNTKMIFDIEFSNKRVKCPECAHTRRKHPNNKDLQYYKESNSAYCFHCGTTFFEYNPHNKEKEYTSPEWKNITNLTDKAVNYFTGRMISQNTLNEMKVYSDTEWMPQFNQKVECICFPFFKDEKLINIKFRGPKKSFKLVSGAELVFWNIDAMKENKSIVIVEGEIDALSFIENGIKNVISVPNGANKNLIYLDNYIDLFDDIETFYMACDQDTKGIELRDEFIRRLGADKCKIVSFKECKDANEYFLKYQGEEFKKLLENAKEPTIEGVYRAENLQPDLYEFYKNGIKPGLTIDNNEIDQFITWESGRLATVTGVPGCGKSEFVDYIVSCLNLRYGWRAAYFTPENYPLKYHYAKLFEKYIGRKFSEKENSSINFDIAYEYINDNFFWILNEEDLTIDTILSNAKFLIKSKGIKILVIDPYNKIDHQYDKSISETQYVSKFLDKLILFGKLNDILIILIAHPRKMDRGAIPSLYDISGSANFYNKTDYGFTVHRVMNEENLMTNEVEVHFQKIKYKHLGKQGISQLKYNYNNGRFSVGTVDFWDNSNWLTKNSQQEPKDDDFYSDLTEVEVDF